MTQSHNPETPNEQVVHFTLPAEQGGEEISFDLNFSYNDGQLTCMLNGKQLKIKLIQNIVYFVETGEGKFFFTINEEGEIVPSLANNPPQYTNEN